MWFFKPKITRLTPKDNFLGSSDSVKGNVSSNSPAFIESKTGRHALDILYEIFAKPQLSGVNQPDNPSIYIKHQVGQEIAGGYTVERVFEDSVTGFYAEGRIAKQMHPPVLVIRGYGSWFPVDGVLQDTPDVFIASVERQFNAALEQGVTEWLKDWTECGNKPDLIGESLGGKVAQQIAAKYSNYLRSTVTFNALGVSEKVVKSSKAEYVFHYFTLGERYAFWANRGDYIPGQFFLISAKGKNCQYKIEEAIIKRAKLSRQDILPARRYSKRKILAGIVMGLILLKRHNDVILNRPRAVVIRVERERLREV